LMLLGRMAVEPEVAGALARLWQTAAMALIGGLTLALSQLSWSRNHARLLCGISVWAASIVLIWATLWVSLPMGADDYILAAIAMVMLTAVSTVPFRPLEIMALGLFLEAGFFSSSWFTGGSLSPLPGHDAAHHFFLLMLVILATGISATNFRRRKA